MDIIELAGLSSCIIYISRAISGLSRFVQSEP